MTTRTRRLTDEDREVVRAVLPSVRRTSPRAARIIDRLLAADEPATHATERPYVTVTEVATAFSVSDQTVRNWVDRGWLPAKRAFGTGPRRIPRTVLASADALARPRPPTADFSDEQQQEILNGPRRILPK